MFVTRKNATTAVETNTNDRSPSEVAVEARRRIAEEVEKDRRRHERHERLIARLTLVAEKAERQQARLDEAGRLRARAGELEAQAARLAEVRDEVGSALSVAAERAVHAVDRLAEAQARRDRLTEVLGSALGGSESVERVLDVQRDLDAVRAALGGLGQAAQQAEAERGQLERDHEQLVEQVKTLRSEARDVLSEADELEGPESEPEPPKPRVDALAEAMVLWADYRPEDGDPLVWLERKVKAR